ncbi:helix-turn-helix domain-containing protein [Afifella sp. IM 167]|uniref:helix-turn-helix domain-containing protein n=1 Tax=Afifella sp. IM 167 TaxID=2033586 RepID=UPI001CCE8343|nr:helix-turn-helix domain-containing protein [Afifella sp. IM 167]MBZ8133992.1 transcriptional regulator [Afifella sp. IM 167]
MDKRDLLPVLRERLSLLMARAGQNRSEFARSVELDRSAITQLLSGQSTRLPRTETLWRIAERHSVSLDWLVGLSQDDQLAAEMRQVLEIAESEGAEGETPLERWHREAVGTKIRYVPTQIPDLLRTERVIEYEYSGGASPLPQTQLKEAEFRLDYNRRPETDMEVCIPRQRLELLAEGRGVWRDLDRRSRAMQLTYMADLLDELYPTFRLFLYDQMQNYSIPYTVFGSQRAAIFVGEMYLVLNATEHIRALTKHFDNLIRQAVVNAHQAADHIRGLKVV